MTQEKISFKEAIKSLKAQNPLLGLNSSRGFNNETSFPISDNFPSETMPDDFGDDEEIHFEPSYKGSINKTVINYLADIIAKRTIDSKWAPEITEAQLFSIDIDLLKVIFLEILIEVVETKKINYLEYSSYKENPERFIKDLNSKLAMFKGILGSIATPKLILESKDYKVRPSNRRYNSSLDDDVVIEEGHPLYPQGAAYTDDFNYETLESHLLSYLYELVDSETQKRFSIWAFEYLKEIGDTDYEYTMPALVETITRKYDSKPASPDSVEVGGVLLAKVMDNEGGLDSDILMEIFYWYSSDLILLGLGKYLSEGNLEKNEDKIGKIISLWLSSPKEWITVYPRLLNSLRKILIIRVKEYGEDEPINKGLKRLLGFLQWGSWDEENMKILRFTLADVYSNSKFEDYEVSKITEVFRPKITTSLMRSLGLNKINTRILDIGAGAGWLTMGMKKQGFQVFGLDIDDTNINIARTELTKIGIADAENIFQKGSWNELDKWDKFKKPFEKSILNNDVSEKLKLLLFSDSATLTNSIKRVVAILDEIIKNKLKVLSPEEEQLVYEYIKKGITVDQIRKMIEGLMNQLILIMGRSLPHVETKYEFDKVGWNLFNNMTEGDYLIFDMPDPTTGTYAKRIEALKETLRKIGLEERLVDKVDCLVDGPDGINEYNRYVPTQEEVISSLKQKGFELIDASLFRDQIIQDLGAEATYKEKIITELESGPEIEEIKQVDFIAPKKEGDKVLRENIPRLPGNQNLVFIFRKPIKSLNGLSKAA